MTEAWLDFFGAQIAASATLLGLLFVGVSLNLQKILSLPLLPARALIALGLLMAVLVGSSAVLIPSQPVPVLGAEVLAVGACIWGCGSLNELRNAKRTPLRSVALGNVILFQIAALPYLVGGGLLLMNEASGLYWLAAAMIFCTIKAVVDAWVLLVEINR